MRQTRELLFGTDSTYNIYNLFFQNMHGTSKDQFIKKNFEEMKIDEGTNFAIFGKDDTLILKKIEVPKANEVFEKVHKWGTELAKKKGWKEEDFIKRINKA